jgi:hypothetical protein
MIRYASASELPCEPAWASAMDGRVCARAKANNVAWTIRGAELASFIFTETSCATRVIDAVPASGAAPMPREYRARIFVFFSLCLFFLLCLFSRLTG